MARVSKSVLDELDPPAGAVADLPAATVAATDADPGDTVTAADSGSSPGATGGGATDFLLTFELGSAAPDFPAGISGAAAARLADLLETSLVGATDPDAWLGFAPAAAAAGPPDAAPGGADGPGIEIIDADFAAKGGGRPGGGGSGGGTDTSVLKNYFSGSTAGTDVNPGGSDPGYDIWIEFKGTGWTSALQQAFRQAADFFTTVITDDIGGGGSYRGKLVDDLYITGELATIDGAGGVLGQAGPSAVWSANHLTAAGQMQFDSADAKSFFDKGLWGDIVIHEMMHVLGFGTLWEYGIHDLVDDNFGYFGEDGLAAYNDAIDPFATVIPVESDGGSGTAGGHWDEAKLGNELMTGYIDNDNYLSSFSVMSLQDLGYNVNEDYLLFPT